MAGAPHSLPGSATTQCAPEDMARLLLHLWFPCGPLLPQPCESLQTQAHSLCVSSTKWVLWGCVEHPPSVRELSRSPLSTHQAPRLEGRWTTAAFGPWIHRLRKGGTSSEAKSQQPPADALPLCLAQTEGLPICPGCAASHQESCWQEPAPRGGGNCLATCAGSGGQCGGAWVRAHVPRVGSSPRARALKVSPSQALLAARATSRPALPRGRVGSRGQPCACQTTACPKPLQVQPREGPAVGRVRLCLVPQVRELHLPFLLRSVLTVT